MLSQMCFGGNILLCAQMEFKYEMKGTHVAEKFVDGVVLARQFLGRGNWNVWDLRVVGVKFCNPCSSDKERIVVHEHGTGCPTVARKAAVAEVRVALAREAADARARLAVRSVADDDEEEKEEEESEAAAGEQDDEREAAVQEVNAAGGEGCGAGGPAEQVRNAGRGGSGEGQAAASEDEGDVSAEEANATDVDSEEFIGRSMFLLSHPRSCLLICVRLLHRDPVTPFR